MSEPAKPDSPSRNSSQANSRAGRVLGALALLYTAQGVPFGLAAEYLPVILRQAGYTQTQIAAAGWLQLPWQLKALWAHIADGPSARRHVRLILLALQFALAFGVLAFAIRSFREAPYLWFALTLLCAQIAATQDIFVDALAVRSLAAEDLGLGNAFQVGGYRIGILIGGALLLVLAAPIGARAAIGLCGGAIAACSIGAFLLRPSDSERSFASAGAVHDAREERLRLLAMLRHVAAPGTRTVLLFTLTYKAGLHMSSVLIKPMCVDAHWTNQQIGSAIVLVGAAATVLGSALGGAMHRTLGEVRALALGGVMQAVVCVPLLAAYRHGVPLGWTTAAVAVEHFGSAAGTTALFAALMTATRPADAGLQYTILGSANNIAIGIGSLLGGFLAHRFGYGIVFSISGFVGLLPLAMLPYWARAARASSGRERVVA